MKAYLRRPRITGIKIADDQAVFEKVWRHLVIFAKIAQKTAAIKPDISPCFQDISSFCEGDPSFSADYLPIHVVRDICRLIASLRSRVLRQHQLIEFKPASFAMTLFWKSLSKISSNSAASMDIPTQIRNPLSDES